MIPASYLFKDYYQRHWLNADPDGGPTAKEPPHRILDGLTRRIVEAMRRPARHAGLRRHA